MESGGHTFPSVEWEGEHVPEAWSYRQDRLPHSRSATERDRLFPRAVAARETCDVDFQGEPCHLEVTGQRIAREREGAGVPQADVCCAYVQLQGRDDLRERGDHRWNVQTKNEPNADDMNKEYRAEASCIARVTVSSWRSSSNIRGGDKTRELHDDMQVRGSRVPAMCIRHDQLSDIAV